MPEAPRQTIALVGLGSIGISFAALHLKYSNGVVHAYDPRPDLEQHVASILPAYLGPDLTVQSLISSGRLKLCSTLEDACAGVSIVQEQGPEDLEVKRRTWSQVLEVVPRTTHLWSSTSGILASAQAQGLKDNNRLLVVHPFNPPHIMPLIEIVPAPATDINEVQFARQYFQALNSAYRPVVVRKEVPGFVANRLAFILFREACHLVANDIVSVEDLDAIVEASLGPRWAVTGPFKSYNYGGGIPGFPAFLRQLSGTMENIWEDSGVVSFRGTEYHPETLHQSSQGKGEEDGDARWTHKVVQQVIETYGYPSSSTLSLRDEKLRKVLQATRNQQ